MNMKMYYKDPDFKAHHGFFGRGGGVSEGIYGSLNCGPGSNDNAAHVQENRARAAEEMGAKADHLLTVHQIHSDICLYAGQPWEERPQADALVTDVPDLLIGVLTADCGPVLLQGTKQDGSPVIGAAHAGWGGALKGILESAVQMMVERGAALESVSASIGPCIGPESYEVSESFKNPFLKQDPENDCFFKSLTLPAAPGPSLSLKGEGKLMFDLPGYCARRLALCGVQNVSLTGLDTYTKEQDYFSYRRATHRKEPDYGRQLSAIMINP